MLKITHTLPLSFIFLHPLKPFVILSNWLPLYIFSVFSPVLFKTHCSHAPACLTEWMRPGRKAWACTPTLYFCLSFYLPHLTSHSSSTAHSINPLTYDSLTFSCLSALHRCGRIFHLSPVSFICPRFPSVSSAKVKEPEQYGNRSWEVLGELLAARTFISPSVVIFWKGAGRRRLLGIAVAG